MNKKIATLLLLLVLIIVSCSDNNNTNKEKDSGKIAQIENERYGGVLIEGSIGDANNLIPILANDLTSHMIASMVYNGLLKYDKNLKLVGDLAKSWRVSEDRKEITFTLKEDVKWHDGKPFTADDVIFTYNTIVDDNTPTPYDADFRKITKIEKINNYKIKVYYDEPYAPALASWTMHILPKHLLENSDITKSYLQRKPVGTGPFKFSNWDAGSYIKLISNEDYFAKRPFLAGYILRIIPDQTSMFMELLNEKIDLMNLTPIQYTKQTNNSRFTDKFNKFKYLSDTYTFVGYNLEKEIFKDKRVRQALSYATPKEKIISGVLLGLGKIATGPYKPGTTWYNENIKRYEYNIEKAKMLLDEAGYHYDKEENIRKKGDNRLSFTIITNQGNENRKKVATILQESWEKIGVNIDIRVLEWATFINEYINKRNFDAVVLAWNIVPDPDIYDVWHSSRCKKGGLNFTCYKNKELDKLIEKGRKTFDTEERRAIYFKIQEILAEEQPYTFLYYPDALVGLHKRFHNVKPAPAGIKYNIEEWFVPKNERIYNYVP
ncbi:MAG: peptide-binding protein [Deferribacterota bacterium]|nr:peptide-binding protein [Deferribacterota bacterium]